MDKEFQVIDDYDGRQIKLFNSTIKHIKQNHKEISDPVGFVKEILGDPILVTEDELPDTLIYHRRIRRPLLAIAYVEIVKKKVKSAHISDKVKGGKVVWMKETKDLIGSQ